MEDYFPLNICDFQGQNVSFGDGLGRKYVCPTGTLQIFDEDQADDFDPFVPLPRKELHSVRVIKVPVLTPVLKSKGSVESIGMDSQGDETPCQTVMNSPYRST